MVDDMVRCQAQGEPWSRVARHMLGLWNGERGARHWRQVCSDHRLKDLSTRDMAERVRQARLAP